MRIVGQILEQYQADYIADLKLKKQNIDKRNTRRIAQYYTENRLQCDDRDFKNGRELWD